MTSARALASRSTTTLDAVDEIPGVLTARYHRDDVLTSVRVIPAREAKFRPIPGWVTSALSEAYHAKGIQELYLHQAATAELVHEGKDVVVVTPTASGKPSYNLPVLHAVPENPDTRALYLFPTKALAQDQLVREALAQLGHSNRAAMIAPGAYRRIKAQFEHRLARLARKAGQTLLEVFDS